MTLKNQKSHFNVKFLKGFGCSINLKNFEVTLKNGMSPFSDSQEKETWYVTKIPYEKIIMSGNGYVSTEAVKLLTKRNIQILITDTYGNPVSFMSNIMNSNTSTKYRMVNMTHSETNLRKINCKRKYP